jgi:hypothetical protein
MASKSSLKSRAFSCNQSFQKGTHSIGVSPFFVALDFAHHQETLSVPVMVNSMKKLLARRQPLTHRKGLIRASAALVFCLTALTTTSNSAHPALALGTNLLTVRGTSTATSAAGSSIAVGDVFTWVATFDLDTPSTGSTASYGNKFNDSLTAFTLAKSSSNTGTWNPSGINWPMTPAGNVDANANGNGITVQLRPTNAPAINSQPFFDVGVSFGWSSSDLDAIWVSGSTTLAIWLGTSSPNLNKAYLHLELRDTNYSSASFSSSLTAVSTTTTTSTSTSTTTSTTSTTSTTTSSNNSTATTVRISGQSAPTVKPGTVTTTSVGGATTTTLPATTTLPPEPAPDAAEVEPGMAAALVNGTRVDLTVARQNNVLQVSSGNIQMSINVIDESGAIVPLDDKGNAVIEKGSRFEFSVTGAQPNANLEAWLFSDPIKLGDTTVDKDGKATGTLTIANKVPQGAHRFVTKTYSSTGDEVTMSIGVIAAGGSSAPIGLIIFIVLIAAILGGLLIPAVRRRRDDEENSER